MNVHRRNVADALEAVAIRSKHRFAWLGETSPPLQRGLSSILPDQVARAFLASRIRARLYQSFYCTGGVERVPRDPPKAQGPADPRLSAELARANTGSGSWERGWKLDGRRGDELAISRDGLRVTAQPKHCRPAPGEGELSVAIPAALPELAPGFFTVVGDLNLQPERDDLVARLYFNVTPAGAAQLVSAVTSALNSAHLPFRLKILDRPASYGRCDAAVLYLRSEDFRHEQQVFGGLIDSVTGLVRSPVPAFTRALAPGVGFAEERGDARESFGARRCRVLAETMLDAHEQRIREMPARLAVVEEGFAADGIDLDTPYLEA